MSIYEDVLEFIQPNNNLPKITRYVGIEDEGLYNSVCRYLSDNRDKVMVIENECLFEPSMEILQEIKKDLPNIDLHHMTSNDLVMYGNTEDNTIYLGAITQVFEQAVKQIPLTTRHAQENWMLTQIVLSLKYIIPNRTRKLCYYNARGYSMNPRDMWLLMIAYCMGMDVLILEPTGSRNDWFKTELVTHPKTPTVMTFQERVSKGKPISAVKTATAMYSKELTEQLFTDTGAYKPWMFLGGTQKSLVLSGTEYDLMSFWNQENRMREGFKANPQDKTIMTPVFFMEFDGVYPTKSEYAKLLNGCRSSGDVLVVTKPSELHEVNITKEERVKFVFDMKPNGKFDLIKLCQHDYVLKQMHKETQKYIVDKLNEYITEEKQTKDERVESASIVLGMSKKIYRMMQGYDYPFLAPKVVVFLEGETRIGQKTKVLLDFLSYAGFDIAIFTPAGDSGYLGERITKIRLPKMVYDLRITDIDAPTFSNTTEPSNGSSKWKKVLGKFLSLL